MFQNHRVFGANQTPGIPSDSLTFAKDKTHVCVLCLNRWYRFQLIIIDDSTDGISANVHNRRRVLTAVEVAEKLYAIQADAKEKQAKFGDAPPVQVLTSQDRYIYIYINIFSSTFGFFSRQYQSMFYFSGGLKKIETLMLLSFYCTTSKKMQISLGKTKDGIIIIFRSINRYHCVYRNVVVWNHIDGFKICARGRDSVWGKGL